ncbi:unnamed protein product [Didymodactylos carnosus]|uniref:Kinesin light chain n=1 Tax=Didymodactylos carnosus TaxID=1234261 RepID=A0A814S3H9_9BILA|nr:unnamed protein product [Didymodactylos carnosus]CAF1142755.1 unnamed protein product [Didymodactylos carnosus]CAF3710332.1 unnamed protein product [Didymodactylos carnosus]CAF3906397.1 unnamed protein product [Didymodactylos carnosus]
MSALPSQDPKIALCLGYVGMVYEYKEDFARALDYYHRQLEMEEQCLPIEHPHLSLHLEKTAKTYKKKEENGEKALQFCQEKLAAQNSILPKHHPRITSTLITLGDISVGKERREYYEQALAALQSLVPSDELLTLTCLEKLAAVAHDEGNGLESIAHWTTILNTRRRIHYPDHTKIAYSLQCIGDVCFELLGNYPEACRCCEESLDIYHANFGPEHRDVIEVEAKLYKAQAQSREW